MHYIIPYLTIPEKVDFLRYQIVLTFILSWQQPRPIYYKIKDQA